MTVGELINRLAVLADRHGNLPVVILDNETDQELREFSALSIGLSADGDEIQIEAYE